MSSRPDQLVSHRPPEGASLIASASRGARFARAAFLATVLALTGAVWIGTASGCSEPLLAARDERSPFDRYDAVRNQHAPQYVENKFGRRQPNLVGRLSPKK